jgi:Uma2 family endonuclease
MVMAVTARRFTVDEVLAWPDDGNRYELVDGVLLVTPAPVPIHQIVATRLAVALSAPVRDWPGVHVANPGEILIRPGIKLEPDVLVFRTPSAHRKWEEIREHWLAVEVFSPSSMIYDREVKCDAYLQVGVREVWLVDLERKTVFVASQAGAKEIPHDRVLRWLVPAASEPSLIDLAEVFSGLD